MKMVQLNLSWRKSVQWLQRYGFCKIRTDGRTDRRMHTRTDGQTDEQTDAGYSIVPLLGFFETAGDNEVVFCRDFIRLKVK